MIQIPESDAGKILVIEDEPSLQALLRMQLQRAGYTVAVAGDGEEGLAAVEAVSPDLILMDVMMPRLDGNEVCRRLRSNVRTRQIPIIMLTARAEPDDRLRGLTVGANDYITKPYEQRELLVRVRNLLDWGRLQRDANPLTGLPGNIAIEAEATRRIASLAPFVFMQIDIDNFKAYNDFYNYHRGDQALRLTALILQRAVDDQGTSDDFVGHVGGDDFVLILAPEKAQEVGDGIVRRFDEEIPSLYSKNDRTRGYVQVENRQGKLERFPLMSLTIAAVSSDGKCFTHVAQISDVAAELKKYGKKQPGSVVVWDRRAG